jgi:glutathione synthase/RimK-type ligase-like ATP-grasp enzyme
MSKPKSNSINLDAQLNNADMFFMAGHLAEAEAIYRRILESDKTNAEVLGLLAITVHQRGDATQAAKLWKRSLDPQAPAWVYVRNLHNYLRALLARGAKDEARRVVRGSVPIWPSLRIPDSGERKRLLALAEMLVELDKTDLALRLLSSLGPVLQGDGELLQALGLLQMMTGDVPSARKTLERAESVIHGIPEYALLAALHQCATLEGDAQATRGYRRRAALKSPIYVSPVRAEHELRVLVMNPMQFKDRKTDRQLHFNGNYPSQIAQLLADAFQFSSVFAEFVEVQSALESLPAPDVIINNIVNAEQVNAAGSQSVLADFADRCGVPVINHPSNIGLTSRDRSAELIADIPGVVAPKTTRFSRTGKNVDDVACEIEAVHDYPLICRTMFFQQGQGMIKVDSRDALVETLNADVPEEFFVTSFVDSRGPTGFYRKLRAAVVGDEIIIVRVDFDTDWNVHGRKSDARVAFYRDNPSLLAMEDRICANPESELGRPVMESLQAIRERIPLEVFGIDFDVTGEGRVVFYEANATMNLLSSAHPEVDHPPHAQARLLETFRSFLRSFRNSRGHVRSSSP